MLLKKKEKAFLLKKKQKKFEIQFQLIYYFESFHLR